MLTALEEGRIKEGDVVIIRYEGPKGGPGMPEMLTPTSAIMGAGLGKDVALLTDGRFSGGSTVLSWGISAPKPRKAARLPWFKPAIEWSSMQCATGSISTSTQPYWPNADRHGRHRPTKPGGEPCSSISKLLSRHPKGV
jgi:hypothetical protein